MPRAAHTLTEIDVPEVEFISPTKVRKAIWSFGDLKAAGPDELKPIVLKHLGEKTVNKLIEFFKASSLLVCSTVMEGFQSSIPSKTTKELLLTGSLFFRSISLSSFLMKALERFWRGDSRNRYSYKIP